jgi:hypothetical protein
MQKCKYCKKEIEDRARKCDKCGSYQTFQGRFVNYGIPIISCTLASVSWVQTYLENQEKVEILEQKEMSDERAVKAENEREVALVEKEEAQQEAIRYGDAILDLENEVNQLQRMNAQSPMFQRKLNVINEKIESAKPATREIDGSIYRKVE